MQYIDTYKKVHTHTHVCVGIEIYQKTQKRLTSTCKNHLQRSHNKMLNTFSQSTTYIRISEIPSSNLKFHILILNLTNHFQVQCFQSRNSEPLLIEQLNPFSVYLLSFKVHEENLKQLSWSQILLLSNLFTKLNLHKHAMSTEM